MSLRKLHPWIGGLINRIGGLILASLLALLFAWLLMLLWNWLMPEIFGLSPIGYWQAWGLILLSQLLFRGGALQGDLSGGRGPSQGRGKGSGNCEHEDFDVFKKEFKNRMRSRWHDKNRTHTKEKTDDPMPEKKE